MLLTMAGRGACFHRSASHVADRYIHVIVAQQSWCCAQEPSCWSGCNDCKVEWSWTCHMEGGAQRAVRRQVC